jgi:hypothetical protein
MSASRIAKIKANLQREIIFSEVLIPRADLGWLISAYEKQLKETDKWIAIAAKQERARLLLRNVIARSFETRGKWPDGVSALVSSDNEADHISKIIAATQSEEQ